MSELKNMYGDNVDWICVDVAATIRSETENGDQIDSCIEVWGETDDGRETRCDVEIADLLESASVAISDASLEIGELKEALFDAVGMWETVCDSYGWDPRHLTQMSNAIDLRDKHKDANNVK